MDIAFQTYVARQALPGYTVTPYLMVPDKSKAATIDGLNQMFPIERLDRANGRISVKPRPELTLADIGQSVLTEINVEEYVNEILSSALEVPGAVGMLPDLARQWAQAYENDIRIEPPVQSQCKLLISRKGVSSRRLRAMGSPRLNQWLFDSPLLAINNLFIISASIGLNCPNSSIQ